MQMSVYEIISDGGRRRHWSGLRIVCEAESAPQFHCENFESTKHDLVTFRREFRQRRCSPVIANAAAFNGPSLTTPSTSNLCPDCGLPQSIGA